jgi:hypothetical protein
MAISKVETERYAKVPTRPAVARDLPRYLGVSRAWITQGMAVLDAPPQVLDAMRRRAPHGYPVTNGLWKRVARMGVEDALRELTT